MKDFTGNGYEITPRNSRELLLARVSKSFPDRVFDNDDRFFDSLLEYEDNLRQRYDYLCQDQLKLADIFMSNPRMAEFIGDVLAGDDALAACVRHFGRDILECVGIFFAIALSVTITVVMEGRSAKTFEALNDINDDTTVTVVRDGEFGKIARELRAANTGMTPLQEKLAKLDELHGRHRRTAVDHSVHAVRGVPAVQRLQQPRAGQRQPVRQSATQ